MVQPWLEAFPRTVKPFMEEVDDILQIPLSRIIQDGPNALLTATENAQPAIMATSIMILRVLEEEFGFATKDRVDFMLGHSLGEFAALVAGGYIRLDDAVRMVRFRAESMAKASKEAREEDGNEVGMVALLCEENRLESMIEAIHQFVSHSTEKSDSSDAPVVEQVLIANINSRNQVVLSGSIPRIKTLLTNLREFGGHDPRAVPLKADSPFHSPLMKPAADVMKKLLHNPSFATGEDVVTFPGLMPCISNVTARPFKSKDELKDLLARQCVETVHWWASIKYLDQEEKVRRWIGIGPGHVGRNLVGKEVGMKGVVKGGGVWGISKPSELEQIMKTLDETELAYEDTKE